MHIINLTNAEKQNNEKLWFLISTNVKEIKIIRKTYDSQIHYLETKLDNIELLLKENKNIV